MSVPLKRDSYLRGDSGAARQLRELLDHRSYSVIRERHKRLCKPSYRLISLVFNYLGSAHLPQGCIHCR